VPADEYLRELLTKYRTDAAAPRAIADAAIYPVLQRWAGGHLRDVRLSGSVAKGTANAGGNDMDLFIELADDTPHSLQFIYASLLREATQHWPGACAQNVSVGITCVGFRFDLVPARLQRGYQNWYSLWRNRAQTWTQTNVEMHIQTVQQSGRIEEIRLLKLWRTLAGLEFPSFILELAAIEALKGRRLGDLASNLSYALSWIGDNMLTVQLVDPSNTNNIVSDDLTPAEKLEISMTAQHARACRTFSDFLR
jgi:hypothetical protein